MNISNVRRPQYALELRSSIAIAVPSHGRVACFKTTEDTGLEPENSAVRMFFDFRQEYPISIEARTSIEDAQAAMVRLGTDALIVTEGCVQDPDPMMVGMITAYDIERERAHRTRDAKNFKGGWVTVGEVLIPWDELPALPYESVAKLRATELYEMLRDAEIPYLLVIEICAPDLAIALGLASRAALAARLSECRGSGRRECK